MSDNRLASAAALLKSALGMRIFAFSFLFVERGLTALAAYIGPRSKVLHPLVRHGYATEDPRKERMSDHAQNAGEKCGVRSCNAKAPMSSRID